MLSFRTRRGPSTGSLKTPVKTVLPCQDTSFGMPTLTESNVPTVRGVFPMSVMVSGWARISPSSSLRHAPAQQLELLVAQPLARQPRHGTAEILVDQLEHSLHRAGHGSVRLGIVP